MASFEANDIIAAPAKNERRIILCHHYVLTH